MPRKAQAANTAHPEAGAKKDRKPKVKTQAARQPEPPKNPEGRPSPYLPDYARIARVMCRNAATDNELAEAFGVSTQTIRNWVARHEDFAEAVKVHKGEFDDRVERSLALRAVGYTYDAVKIFMPAGADKPVYAAYKEHVPPDPGAAKMWLHNRRPTEWREKSHIEHDVSDGLAALLKAIDGGGAELV